MSKKLTKVLAIIVALVMVFSLSACGKNDTVEGDVTIRFYNYALSETAKADWWKEKIADFESKNPGIKVEPISVDYNSMVTTFTNDIATGLSVDLIYGEGSWVPALASAGFIQQPKDVLSKDFYSGYNKEALEIFKYDNGIYAVPHYITNSVIFVNEKLITAAGLSLNNFPTTLDGLKVWIDTLSKYYQDPKAATFNADIATVFGLTTAEVPATGSNINAMLLAFGGELLTKDGKLADLTTGNNKVAVTEMLDFYNYLIKNKYTIENQKLKDYRSAFGAGNVAMYVDSSWGYAQIQGANANAGEFTKSAALPTTMGTYGKGDSLIESHSFLIGAKLSDAQKSAVDKFLQYCTSTEVMDYYLNNIGLAFVAHDDMNSVKVSPILAGAQKGIGNTKSQTNIQPIISVQTKLAALISNYAVNKMTLDQALAQYIKDANYYING